MPPPEDTRQRLVEYYELYNPSKLSVLDTIIRQYPDPTELFESLEQQYGPEPWKLRNPLRDRLIVLLQCSNIPPSRADELLETYRGREMDLFRSLENVTPTANVQRDTVLSLLLSIDPNRVGTADELLRQWSGREDVLIHTLREELKSVQEDVMQRKAKEASLCRGREILNSLRTENNKVAEDVRKLEMQVLQVRIQRSIQRLVLREANVTSGGLITLSVTDVRDSRFYVPAEESLWIFLQAVYNSTMTENNNGNPVTSSLLLKGIDLSLDTADSCSIKSSHHSMVLLFPDHLFAMIMREWCAVSPHTVSVQEHDGLKYFPGEAWWRRWPVEVTPMPCAIPKATNVLARLAKPHQPVSATSAGDSRLQGTYFDPNSVVSAKLREVKYDEISDVMKTEPGAIVGGRTYWSFFVDEWEMLSKELSSPCMESDYFGAGGNNNNKQNKKASSSPQRSSSSQPVQQLHGRKHFSAIPLDEL